MGRIASTSTNADALTGLPNTYMPRGGRAGVAYGSTKIIHVDGSPSHAMLPALTQALRRIPTPDYQLGNRIIMPPLTSMLQVKRYVRLSLSTRSVPTGPLGSGMQRARSRLAALGGLKLPTLWL